MGFGTQNQLGNRTGITNQTSLADIFGGGMNPTAPPANKVFGQTPDFPGGNQNQLFTLLQSLLGGQGLQTPGIPTNQPPGGAVKQPPIGFAPPPGKVFGQTPDFPGGGQITPPGLGQQFDGFGGTPLTQLSNPFSSLINQRAIR